MTLALLLAACIYSVSSVDDDSVGISTFPVATGGPVGYHGPLAAGGDWYNEPARYSGGGAGHSGGGSADGGYGGHH